MSAFNSTQQANSIAVPPTMATPREKSGRERVAYCAYSTPASAGPAAADTLNCFRLPKGARVTSMEIFVPGSFVTSSAKIGYGTIDLAGTITLVDDDRWGSGIDLSSVGRKQFLTVPADLAYEVLNATDNPTLTAYSEVVVILTFTTGNPAASKDIAVQAKYVVD